MSQLTMMGAGSHPAAGGAPISIAQIAALSPHLFWTPRDKTKLWQDTGRTTQVATSGQTAAYIDDASGNGRDMSQPTAADEPAYTVSGGATYFNMDASDHFLSSANPSSLTAASLFFCINTADTAFVLMNSIAAPALVFISQQGSSNPMFSGVGTPTVKVDGSTVSGTRNDLYNAVKGSVWRTVEIAGLDFSASSWASGFRFGNYGGGFEFVGGVSDFIIFATAPSQSNIDNLIFPFLQQGVGLA